ncbi:MAG: Trk system potassium transporter TrkA [Ruminococcaceae bacterium]|nr:Trk system potassium transporter TrkA [Oscillospiraceae bacterium]
MNIIIAGCGKVGQKIAQQLHSELVHNITVIDVRPNAVQDLANQTDVMGVVGSVISMDVMEEAGIKTADILIAVTGSDELNMLACLLAKKLGKCQTIARVRKPEYAKVLKLFREELSLALVINPEQAAASEMARSLRLPSAIQIDTFAKSRVEIFKFCVPEGSVLDNLKVQDIVAKLNSDVLVCGVERGEETFIPGGNFVIKSGDLLSILTPIHTEAQFFKKIGLKSDAVKDTMIVGGGETAYYLASKLCESGVRVKIIEKDEKRCDELCQLLPKATIINGDGTDNNLLLEEGIETVDSFVSLINIDEENVLLSLYAKSVNNGKVITKINRIAYDRVIEKMDLGTTVYPKNITSENIIKFVRAMNNSMGSNIESMHYIIGGKAEALEFRIKENSPILGKRIDKLNLKDNLLIACITRNNRVKIPRGSDEFMVGDTVIIVTLHSGFDDIGDILNR